MPATKAKRATSTKSRAAARTQEQAPMREERMSYRSQSSGSGAGSFIRNMASNPAVKYVAGGIATALINRVITNLSTKYPEITTFLRENLDNVEGKLGEFKNGLNGTPTTMTSRESRT